MEGVSAAIRRFFPALCDARNGLAGPWIKPRQPLEERQHHPHFRLAGHQRWIQRLRLCSIKNDEVSARFLASAAGGEKTQDRRQQTAEKKRPLAPNPRRIQDS